LNGHDIANVSDDAPNRQLIQAGREIARGSAWMIAMRWAIRGVGLVSTVILARLLTPEDFGVVAMAMVAVAMLEVFTQSGVDLALLRTEAPTREHYDAAWTLEIIQGLLLGAVLFLSAPLVGGHFEDERVTLVVQLLSLRAVIGGFQNIGVVDFRRRLAFGTEFKFGVYKKLLTFSVTIVAALLLRNYWALVAGQVFGRIFEVGLSYGMSDYRPRLAMARIGEIWGFSRWLILSRFARLLNRQFDRWVVGSVGGAAAMGSYYIATDLASSPSDEVVMPMSRAAFPVYSRLQDDPVALRTAFVQVLQSMTSVSFVMGFGIGAVAHDFVSVVLGSQWLSAVPLIPWLGLFGALYGLVHTIDIFLVATGRERVAALLTVWNAFLLVPVLIVAGHQGSIEGIAASKAVMAIVFVLGLVWVAGRRPPLTLRAVWDGIWPSLTAATVMVAAIKLIQWTWSGYSPPVGLIRDVACGAVVYFAAMWSIWMLQGRPDGPVSSLATKVSNRLLRRG
jgi:O-antigen/teichoic acid export membrane protein